MADPLLHDIRSHFPLASGLISWLGNSVKYLLCAKTSQGYPLMLLLITDDNIFSPCICSGRRPFLALLAGCSPGRSLTRPLWIQFVWLSRNLPLLCIFRGKMTWTVCVSLKCFLRNIPPHEVRSSVSHGLDPSSFVFSVSDPFCIIVIYVFCTLFACADILVLYIILWSFHAELYLLDPMCCTAWPAIQ